MKERHIFLGILSLLAVSCTMNEIAAPDGGNVASDSETSYYATIEEQPKDPETKTYADEDLRVLWNHDDRVTIFEDIPYGVELYFVDGDGATGGGFNYVSGPAYYGGTTDLGNMKYAVYPHSSETQITSAGAITYIFPGSQEYAAGSFGRGANVMVAKTEASSKILSFKNAGGYLSFKLFGDNVYVSSVILKSNNGEPLSGESTITIADGVPQVAMKSGNGNDEVRISCEHAVLLGSSEENATEFRFVLPPMEFSELGFTITVNTPDGGTFTQTGPMSFSIERNKVLRVSPLKVVPVSLPEDESIKINGISSAKNHKTEYNEESRAFTITLPTVTDFSSLVLDYGLEDGDILIADGVEIENGVTPVDASKPVALVVRRGDHIMRYTLIARNTGLPVVRITTSGFTLNDIESYQNSLQSADKLDHRVWLPVEVDEGTFVRIENADGTPGMNQIKKDGSVVPVYEVITQVKGRGNYTWKWDKKPYALKFDSKREVLGMPAHKRWVLLANWRDRTLLRNDAAFWLSKEAGMPYTTRGQFVELEINGEHRGNYYLCEQIKIDANRVNISELKEDGFADLSGGYLMEIDSYWDELNKFKSAEFNLKYMFKEPDEDPADATTDPAYAAGYAWMENYINEFEKVLKTESDVANHLYENYLDVDSAIWFMLLNELTGNRDFFQNGGEEVFGPHSTYLYKDKGGKLFMGPIWDFDYETFIPASYYSSWGSSGFKWRGFDNAGYYYHFLCYDQQFVDRIKALWNSKKADFAALTTYIDTMAANISLSQKFDEEIWPFHNETNRNDNHDYTLSFEDAIARMKTSFNAKLEWMDSKINSLSRTSPTFKYK